jgi:hypothetical protein
MQQITQRQRRALDLLVDGATTGELAKALHVDRATVWRWTQDPAFAAELAAMRQERRGAAERRIESLVARALDFLGAVVDDPGAPVGARVRAAVEIIGRVLPRPPSEEPHVSEDREEEISRRRARLHALQQDEQSAALLRQLADRSRDITHAARVDTAAKVPDNLT